MVSQKQKICLDSQLNELKKLLSSQKIAVLLILSLFSAAASQKDGDVKLVSGPTKYKGTVAVYYQNAWGTICDDSWTLTDATVICKQLGYEKAERALHLAHYGQGPGSILIDQIRCPYDADHILQCTPAISNWGIHDCSHIEDAGVDCIRKEPAHKPESMPVKLLCPEFLQGGSCKNCSDKLSAEPGECSNQTAVEGVVFAYYNNVWNPVSGKDFGEEEAKVVCGELGYTMSFPSPPLSELWENWDGHYLQGGCKDDKIEEGSGQKESDKLTPLCSEEEVSSNDEFRKLLNTTLLKSVDCVGNEGRLLDCYFPEFGPHAGSGLNVATVRCGFKPHRSCSPDCKGSTCNSQETYRLRSGIYPWTGRVEVRTSQGTWGTVCSAFWSSAAANIVCRALGYGPAKKVLNTNFGRGSGDHTYFSVKCKGDEATLADCNTQYSNYHWSHCRYHRRDVGIECSVPEPCTNDSEIAKLVDVRSNLWPFGFNQFVSVKGPQGWGAVCSDSLNARAANVICRSTRGMFGTRMRKGNMGEQHGGVLYSGEMNCTGFEMSLSKCNVSLTEVKKCNEQEVIVDCTPGLPDLVPDMRTLRSSLTSYPYISFYYMVQLECAVEEKCVASSAYGAGPYSQRFLLRFSSLTMNWGSADFQPNLGPDKWEWHTCHRHYHSFEAFIHYDLLHADTGVKAAEGHKASFCLEDSTCTYGGAIRFRCSAGLQGISPNCGDLYGSHLDCQWIDVTDVPSGEYILRLLVNPDFLTMESDYLNNELSCRIKITDYGYYRLMETKSCQLSDH